MVKKKKQLHLKNQLKKNGTERNGIRHIKNKNGNKKTTQDNAR